MRRITLTALAVLCSAALSVSAQDNKDAEQLFKKMEAKLDKAKAIDLSFDIATDEEFGGGNIQKGTRFKGTLAALSGNKGRMEMSGDGKKSHIKLLMISDGIQTSKVFGGHPEVPVSFPVLPRSGKTPKTLTAGYLTLVARSGILMSIIPLPPDAFANNEVDYKDWFPVSGFKLGKKEIVGERETQQVDYVLGVKGKEGTFPVRLWIDLKTGLPVKRQVGDIYSETYKLTLDGKLDPKKFEIPKIKRVEK